MEEILISVVIPVCNVCRYVSQCLESVIQQSYNNLEVIVIDDGSTDGSGQICDAFSKRDDRINVVHTKNNGLASARNTGLQKARGQFLFFVDSDDWLELNTIETQLHAALQTNADIVIAGGKKEYRGRSIGFKKKSNGLFYGQDILSAYTNGIVGDTVWNKLYRVSCFSNIRFPDGHNYEDVYTTWKLISKLANNDGRIAILSERLYHFRMRKSSIIHNKTFENIKDMWNAYLEKYEDLYAYKERLIQECIQTIGSMWVHYYCFSKKERVKAVGLVDEMKSFSRKHFRQIMRGNYPFAVKVCSMLTQWKSTRLFCFWGGSILLAINNKRYILFD